MERYTDEIDLQELILVLWRYRKMILILFVAAVLTSGLISFFVLPPVYESSATIHLGNFDGSIYSDRATAGKIFTSDRLLEEAAEELGFDPRPSNIQSLKKSVKAEAAKDNPCLELTVTDSNPARAQKTATKIVEIFAGQSQLIYERKQEQTRERYEKIESGLGQVKQQIATVEDIIDRLEDHDLNNIEIISRHIEALALLTELNNSLASREGYYFSIIKQLQDLEPLQVISGPSLPTTPVSPHKKLNMALAGILSLMVGVLLAFILDYFARNPLNIKTAVK